MKTKILGIVTMVTVLLMMLVSSVNAATMTADKTEMQKEEIVTITVTTETEVNSMQFDIEYDASKFEYVANSFTSPIGNTNSNVIEEGVVRVSAYNVGEGSTTATLQFKALDNVENAEFTVSNTEFGVDAVATGETVENPTLTVSVVDPVVEEPEEPGDVDEPTNPEEPGDVDEPTNPEEPGDVDEPTNPEKPSDNDNDSDYVDEDGNPITKLPQTGSVVPAIIAGVAILVVASLVVFKATRK